MDPEWCGAGWYRPADGSSWKTANGSTKWIPCEIGSEYGRPFNGYGGFKAHKRDLRLRDKLDALSNSK
jgi:hypothetical protein